MIERLKEQLAATAIVMEEAYGTPPWSVYVGAIIGIILFALPILYILFVLFR